MKIFFFLLGTTCLCFISNAQLENAQWRFATNLGLDFTTTPPSVVPSQASGGGDACSSIADANGNLLFYVYGSDVKNKNNQTMNINAPLTGGGSTQGILIVKKPGNNPLYFIFMASNQGLRYSIVDMSLAAGLGSVTVSNVILTSQAQTYKIAGTVNCNETEVWIVSQDDKQNTWRAYLVSASGISAPIISSTAHTHVVYAAMKFSPDGSKIASSEWGDGIYLYDFNKNTGAVSGMTVVAGQGYAAWGLEFSPDGHILYGTRSTSSVFQWDLNAGNALAIAASQYTVWNGFGSQFLNQGALQLGIDGKIYQAYGNAPTISVIHNPNGLGAACNYSYSGLNVSPKTISYGLPNQVKPIPPPLNFNYSLSQATCMAVQFTPTVIIVAGLSSNTSAGITWNFGDPNSGALNTSNLYGPSHIFSSPGTYTVQMIVTYSSCANADTIINTIVIPNNIPQFSISGNTLICFGDTATLAATGASNYTWSSAIGNFSGSSIAINPTVSSVFTVTASNGSVCTNQSTIAVTLVPQSIFQISGPDTICLGQVASFTASGVQNYTWTTAVGPVGNGPQFTVSPANTNTYTIFGTNSTNTCLSKQSIILTVCDYPQLVVTGSTGICAGEFIMLSASGAGTVTWNYAGGTSGGYAFATLLSASQVLTVTAKNKKNPCITQSLVPIQVIDCTGIDEQITSSFNIFPSLFKDKLTIESDVPFKIIVTDIWGRTVYENQSATGAKDIFLNHLETGTYFVHIQTDLYLTVRRVVKDRD